MSAQARISANKEPVRRANDSLPNLKIGDALQLQFVDYPERGRFSVKVIGYNQGRSLIISAPANNGSLLMLIEGQQFVVRSLTGKQIMAFQAEVLRTCMVPYPYVHLRIQRAPERLDVRNAHRVDVDLVASVRELIEADGESIESQPHTVKLVDISTSGCLLRSGQALLQDSGRVTLSCRFEVAEHSRTLSLQAVVCSHREMQPDDADSPVHLYGLRFEELDEDRRLVLNCFVYENMVRELYDG